MSWTIKGHTVQSGGNVYDPDVADFVYIPSWNRVDLDNGTAVPVFHDTPASSGSSAPDYGPTRDEGISHVDATPVGHFSAQPGNPAAASPQSGGGSGAAAGVVVTTGGGAASGGRGAASRLVVSVSGYEPGGLGWPRTTAFSDAPKIPGLKNVPLERTGIGGHQEAPGAISDIGWVKTPTGWTSIPSADMKDRMDDDIFQSVAWHWRNKVQPDLMMAPQPFPAFLDPEKVEWNWLRSEWQPKPEPSAPSSNQRVRRAAGPIQ